MCRCNQHQFRTDVDKPSAGELAAAVRAFETDGEVIQDRMIHKKFENMPPALQWWWVDRVAYLKRAAAQI
jgi:hypothetical protein